MARYFSTLAAIMLLVAPGSAADPPKKPNIVLLLADDLGRHDCGFMGGTEIKTPHLDKLASGGANLDAFYVLPLCSPTRAALLTGRYPMRHGLQVGVVRPWAQYGLPIEERTLPQALKEVGYATAIIGKWHLGHSASEYLPTRRGFDRQYGHHNGAIDYFTHFRIGGFDWHRNDRECRDEGYATDLIAKEAVKFIEEAAGKKPFFLYVPFNAVHAPYQVPEKYLGLYSKLSGERRNYAGMLSAMDEAVGRIVAATERAGVRRETLFIFSSDNGGPRPGVVTYNGKFRAGKGTLYEGGVRVAAFANWEGRIRPGSKVIEPLHIVDLYPTLLSLAGAKPDQGLEIDGKNAWTTISEGRPTPHREILINTTPNSGALRAGDWKLVVSRGKEDPDNPVVRKGTERTELFNLWHDPYEKTNLAVQYPDKVKELRARLDDYSKRAISPKAKPKPKDFVVPRVWGEKN